MIVARAPNHLGDGVMTLPAMHALAALDELVISAPRWGPELYRDVAATVIPRGPLPPADTAVLFSPSLRAAWQARRARRRIGTPTDHRRWLLTDPVAAGVHQTETYARLAAAAGAVVKGDPQWVPRRDDPDPEVPRDHVGLNPISASGAVREWPGFAALAARLPDPVVVYGGPGEEARVLPLASGRSTRIGLSLAAFGRALQQCRLFVSNDSGAAHFARACGTPTIVLYGSTIPAHSGPIGADAVFGPRPACAPCRGRWCPYDLDCLRIPVDVVLARIAAKGNLSGPAE
jgi:heptosyltransferase II